ncbi:MAG: hypothetical protein HYZ36_07785, partial [Pedosphaera parvula]|nr:hypothetical protein [Pedosphaera parvula]
MTATTEPDGSATVQTNTYTQLETGLSYLDGTGQYRDAVAEFEVVPGAAVAQRTQHKVVLAANANTDEAVELWMPDGEKLVSHVLGLGYFDRATGKSVVIAELKDSEGVLSESKDQVLYPDCFTLGGTLRYRLTKYGLEQDVILTEQPPAPEDYGLSSEFAQLQIITEFVKHPKPALNARVLSKEVDPEKRKALAEPDVLDDTIDFPTIQIGSGRAFALSEEQPEIDPGQGVAVAKSWQTIEGRTVLFEEVSYGELKPALEKLPARPQANVGGKRKPVASLKRALPQVRLAKKDTAKVIQVAEARLPNKGVVVDYQATLVDSTGFTFRADTTYRVTGTVNLSGTTTIEAGTVLKYDAVSTAMV